jgi:peptidoglycan hydrolase-like protein with peptidoglycan-binding domain
MNRARWAALAAVVALIAVTATAYGLTRAGDDDTAAVGTAGGSADGGSGSGATTSTEPPTTTSTTEATTTTTEAPPAPPSDALRQGSEGPAVADLQRRLTELHFDPGPADGTFGVGTLYAVQGFQKLHGLAPDGVVGPQVREALANPVAVSPMVPDGGGDRVEVDLRRQLLFLYDGGELRLISHVSTGSGERYCVEGDCQVAHTPAGAYRFSWRYSGWRESRLGKLYNPVYFTRSGIAVHGSQSVPTYPASHGCVRIPMHIAEYFPSLVRQGDAVYVLDGRTDVGPAPAAPATLPPPPPDPPTSPEPAPSTTTTTTTAPPDTTTTTAPPETTTTTAPPESTTSSTTTSTTIP